jgi:putative transport protein
MSTLLAQEMLVLFAILAIGSGIGRLSYKGISLGPAGVLFTAMVFGHFGLTVPRAIMDLGLLLFVYSVGLQAGPRFFRTFRAHGIQYVVIALAVALAGGIATVIAAVVLKLPYQLASGLFTGALTCTPALAAALDAIERIAPGSTGNVSVGYGIAYPFSMVGVVLLVQFLPQILGRKLKEEEERWQEEKRIETPGLEARQYLVTNPNLHGKTVREINPHRMFQANISRVKRGEKVFAAVQDIVIEQGDVIMVVGTAAELDKLQLLFGEETHVRMDMNTSVLSTDVEVTEPSLTGKPLAELRVFERYNVVITRIRRQGQEVIPGGSLTLEMGDNIRVVGDRRAVEEFAHLVHGARGRGDETNMVPFLVGLLLGVAVGSLPITLQNGLQIKLGIAGGAFLVSLLVGHFGGIGRLKLYVPPAARNITRELGLILFLSGAGVTAGQQFVQIISERGPALLIAGAIITISAVLAGLLVMHFVYRMNTLSIMGALTATMTNPPGLSAANSRTSADLPTLSYASVYPVALIFKIILAQVLVEILRILAT